MTTPSPYVTVAALDDVKNSIQELRSILLQTRGLGGALDGEANYLETDQRGRDSRRSGEIPRLGEPIDDTASVGPIPLSPPPPAPTIIMDGPSHRRRGQTVRVLSPGPSGPSPVVIQVPSPRSSRSRSPTYIAQPYYDSHRTDATARELESVISDFSSIVIIVCISLKLSTLVSRILTILVYLPRLLSSLQYLS